TVTLTNSRDLRVAGSVTVDPIDIRNDQGGPAKQSMVAGGTLTLGGITDRNWNGCCQALTINNAGTLIKTGSNAVAGSFSLTNSGVVQVNAGTLTVQNGIFTPSTATGTIYTVSTGATLENAGGSGTIAAGNLGGGGTLADSAGTLTLSTVSSTALPNLNVNGGRLKINGNNSAASLT